MLFLDGPAPGVSQMGRMAILGRRRSKDRSQQIDEASAGGAILVQTRIVDGNLQPHRPSARQDDTQRRLQLGP